jgi:hypothetical protein
MSFLFNPGLFLLSIVSGVAAWAAIFVMLNGGKLADANNRWLEALLSVHIFRYIGLVALVPTHVDPTPFGWSQFYLSQVAFGDWTAGILAVLGILGLRYGWKSTMAIIWAFAIIGTADTLNAGASIVPQIHDQNLVSPLGWLILTIYVPGLVVTELLTWIHLVKRVRQPKTAMTLRPMNAAPSM